MLRSCTIMFFPHQQPDEAAWEQVERFVTAWNNHHNQGFESVAGLYWQLTLTQSQSAELKQLLAAVRDLRERYRVAVLTSQRDTPEPADYAAADFLEVLGVDLKEPRPLVQNASEAFVSTDPCPVCGAAGDDFDVVQTQPLVVDLSVLRQPSADGAAAPATGWDVVDGPGGRLLLSRRALDLLPTDPSAGIVIQPVIDAATGQPSDSAAQLLAELAIPQPCPAHTRVVGNPFCRRCGTAHGVVEGYIWIPQGQIGARQLVSRHPSRAALLSFAHPLHRRLLAAGLTGLQPTGLFMICRHETP